MKLEERMKDFYESITKYKLPRRTHTIIRLDGKAFHTYTKGLITPFDNTFISDMNKTAEFLCKEISGAKFAFVQSDEISICMTDFDKKETDAWFRGEVQKMSSISASLCTAKFNELRPGKLAFFDSRCFTIPFRSEVINYFIWRQEDTVRNSIQSLAQSLFSHGELINKNIKDLISMCESRGVSWDNLDSGIKYGRFICKETYLYRGTERTRWVIKPSFVFSKDSDKINVLLETGKILI